MRILTNVTGHLDKSRTIGVSAAFLLAVVVAVSQLGCGAGSIDAGAFKPTGDETANPVGPQNILAINTADLDREVVLGADRVVAIELPSNLSTGYRWEINRIESERLQVIGSEFIQEGDGLLGAPGKEIYYLVGASAGKGTVEFAYQRPRMPEQPLKTAAFRFAVEGRYLGNFQMHPRQDLVPAKPLLGSGNLGLPAHFSWCEQGGCTPIKDQGSCGSCWAFATVGPFESAIKLADGDTEDLSEQYLVSCNSDGWSCNGGWWGHDYHWNKMVSGETEAGAVLETNFPYTATDVACNPPHSKVHHLDSWSFVTDASSIPTVDQLKQAISSYGPITVAVCVNSEFQMYTSGVFTGPSCTGVNHGVVLVGWDDTDGAWILRNSWSSSWGEAGYMRIGYNVSQVGYAAAYVVYGGAKLHADFSISTSGLSATFTDLSKPAAGGSIQGWAWNFGDGGSSSVQNPSYTFAAAGTYPVTLTVTDNTGATASASQNVTVPFVPKVCDSSSQDCSYEWISGVQIDSFSNASGAGYYSDFTGQVIALQPGSHSITITPSFNGGPWYEYFNVWIDLNGNASFSDAGELVFSSYGSAAVSGAFTIPDSVTPGKARMRVSMRYATTPPACGTYDYGEVEDYTVDISGGGSPPIADFSFTAQKVLVAFADQSSDPDNDIVSWAWNFGDGSGSSEQNPSHAFAASGTYTVSLTVTDSRSHTGSISKDVAVQANRPPVAEAGADQAADTGSAVGLDGSASSDPDGDALTFTWTQTTGPVATFSDAHAVKPTFMAPQVSAATVLTFSLVVNDGLLDSPTDVVSVTVNPKAGPALNLFFSEYLEGTGYNKALEIYNGGSQAVSLSGCMVRQYNNGVSNPTHSISLGSATLNAGAVLVVCHKNSSAAILAKCNLKTSALDFNGNDAIALFCKNATVNGNQDVVGTIGQNPGQAWGTAPNTTMDHTLVRKCSVTQGDPNGTDAFDPAQQFVSFPKDTVSFLGSHCN